MAQASTTYRFARDPKAEIARAIRRTIEERSDNPRVSWQALCKSANQRPTKGVLFCAPLAWEKR